jgi:Fe2+ or Zn2+ uptake regulation protein
MHVDKLLNKEADVWQHDEELAEAILQYLAEHPHAMDTLEGIAEWWLMRQQVRVQVNALARVLRQLTEQGFLEAIGSGEDTRYRLKG